MYRLTRDLRTVTFVAALLAVPRICGAGLLVHLTFDDGLDIGTAVTSSLNRGSLGGSATGSDLDNAGPGGVRYGAGSTGLTGDLSGVFIDANTGGNVGAAGGRVLFSIPSGVLSATSDWTITAAVRIDAGNVGFDRIVDPFFNTSDGDGYGVGFPQSYTYPDATSVFRDGKWHHLAFTYDYDGSTNLTRAYTRSYVDGVLVAAAPFAIRVDYSGGLTLSLGAQVAGSRPFDGAIDDVRFYDELLSAQQVAELVDIALVPEPGALGMLVAASAVFLARQKRGRPPL